MRVSVCLLIVACLLCALWSCDDEEEIVGCRLYNHIFNDYVGAGTEHDTVYVFFAADHYAEYSAPLTFDFLPSASFSDSIGLELTVYGVSHTEDPQPYMEIEWRSDTLLVWYSGTPPRLDVIQFDGLRIPATPPCPTPYYRIDHVIVQHSAEIVVYPYEDVLF